LTEDSFREKLSKTKKIVSYKKEEILPFIGYILIPIAFVTDGNNRLLIAAVISISGFILTTVVSKLYIKPPSEGKVKASRRFTFFFGMIYIFVAGTAVTTALDIFSHPTLTNILVRNFVGTQQLQNILLLFSFFATAISFFHGGITFLATDAVDILTKGKGSHILPHFLVIFSQVVLLYFMATQVSSIISFSKLCIALMVIDIIWVARYHRNRDLVFIEWGHYNSMTVFFLIILLTIPLSLMSFVLLFLITILRSLCDYIIGWTSFYSKHPLQEM
jgi:hypothetical protein